MGLNCGCPTGAHLEDLEITDCKESFGQIQKILIQRIYKTPGLKNSLMSGTAKLTKAAVTAFTSAADSTKLIVSPYIQNPTTEPGAARTFGGGNATLGGIEIVIGREPTTFTGIIYEEAQSTIKTLKSYSCEKIGVYLVDEYGNIGALKQTEAGTGSTSTVHYRPIPVDKFFVGDKKLGGFEEPDSNSIEWSFYPNWSDDLVIIKADDMDFNALTDLTNSASA